MGEKLIAVVDDEPGILKGVSDYLTNRGFNVRVFSDGDELFRFLEKDKADLIVLDLMLPGMSGLEVCRRLKRSEKLSSIPVIMLSAKKETSDRIFGLDLGADDYVTKPFSPDELEARIRSVLRRARTESGEKKINIYNTIEIDLRKCEAKVRGKEAELTPVEFNILKLLASKKGQVFTRERILDYLWGEEKVVVERTVDVHIRHLRQKLGKAGGLIKNMRGFGYKLEKD